MNRPLTGRWAGEWTLNSEAISDSHSGGWPNAEPAKTCAVRFATIQAAKTAAIRSTNLGSAMRRVALATMRSKAGVRR